MVDACTLAIEEEGLCLSDVIGSFVSSKLEAIINNFVS